MVKNYSVQKSLIFLLVIIFSLLILSFSAFAETEKNSDTKDSGKACIYYFYGQGCEGCSEISSFLNGLKIKYPQLKLQEYEVYYRAQNMDMVKKYFTAYHVPEPSQGLPVVFTPTTYLVGQKPIFEHLEQQIKDSTRSDCPSLEAEKGAKIPGIVSDHFPLDIFKSLSFQIITGGALRDAFRPGMLALGMLLMILLTTLPSAHLLLRRGLLYVVIVFAVHFLFAVGLLMHLAASPLAILFYRLVGWAGIIFGLWVLFTFFWGKKMHLLGEEGKKKLHEAQLEIISALGFFLIALIGGVLSFSPLTTTFLVLPHAFRGDSGWAALPIVLYYLLIVMAPLLIVTLVLARVRQHFDVLSEKKMIKVEGWKLHYRKMMQLVVAIMVLILGVVVLFW